MGEAFPSIRSFSTGRNGFITRRNPPLSPVNSFAEQKGESMQFDLKVKGVLGLDKVNQVGIVVRDMDRAIKNYREIFGISFPKVLVPDYFNRVYRGKPENFRMKIGLAMMGELQIELIEPLEGKTIYGEFLKKWGDGIHHLGFDVNNLDERVAAFRKSGIDVLMSGERVGGKFAYMDTEGKVGIIVELIQREKGL
jgi:methylmalonyl-CoA/ethylmalonyl-CoA epimerase